MPCLISAAVRSRIRACACVQSTALFGCPGHTYTIHGAREHVRVHTFSKKGVRGPRAESRATLRESVCISRASHCMDIKRLCTARASERRLPLVHAHRDFHGQVTYRRFTTLAHLTADTRELVVAVFGDDVPFSSRAGCFLLVELCTGTRRKVLVLSRYLLEEPPCSRALIYRFSVWISFLFFFLESMLSRRWLVFVLGSVFLEC